MRLRLGIASGDRISAERATDGKNHWGGAGWVRLGQYIPLLDFDVVVGTLVWNRTHFSIRDSENRLCDVDIVYLQRLMHDTLPEHINLARKTDQIIVNDLDDWYWGLSTNNAAYLASHPKTNPNENIRHYKSVLNASTTITVSTPYLRDRLTQMIAKCPPIEVLQNTVDVARFQSDTITETRRENRQSLGENRPIVGWVGSTEHRSGDLEVLRGIMKPMHDSGLLRVQHSGYHVGSRSVADVWGITETDMVLVPASEPEDYPNILTMDIGLAPLSRVPFNFAKSDIKLLEYSAVGIPWVASDAPAYEALQKVWGLGRIAKKNKAVYWKKHITELLDPVRRQEEGVALQEAVWSRDIAVGAKALNDYLHSLL